MGKWSKKYFLFLFLFSCPLLFGVCTDSLSTYNCYSGNPSDWEWYDSLNPSGLWDINTCAGAALHQCDCGDTDPTSPCAGCPYQSYRTAGNCYSDTSCSVPCTPAHQLPVQSKFTNLVLSILLGMGFGIYYQRNKRG